MEAYVKIRRVGKQVLLAACDVDILGRRFEKEDLFFKVKEEFYKGSKIGVDEALDLIRESTIINLLGFNIVNRAIEKGYVHPEAVIKICGVLHAQIVRI